MLMQKGANINVSVIQVSDAKTENNSKYKKPEWRWLPDKKPETDSHTEVPVFQV